MFNYIINSKDRKKYFINSKKGIQLLRNYINLYVGGKNLDFSIVGTKKTLSNRNKNLNKCNSLYGQTVSDKVENECNIKNYRTQQAILDSIAYKVGVWEETYPDSDLKDRSYKISKKVVDFLKNKFKDFLNNNKVITVLGPLEDILGFFYKFNSNSEPLYKKFFFLSVNNDDWSLDLNHDFITCTSPTDKNNFENMYEECPIILINKGETNILNEFPNQNVRVTHWEKTWINNLLKKKKKYKWRSEKIKDEGEGIFINMLVKKNKK